MPEALLLDTEEQQRECARRHGADPNIVIAVVRLILATRRATEAITERYLSQAKIPPAMHFNASQFTDTVFTFGGKAVTTYGGAIRRAAPKVRIHYNPVHAWYISSKETPMGSPLSWAPPRPGPGGRPRTASPGSGRHTRTRRSRSRPSAMTGSGRSPAQRRCQWEDAEPNSRDDRMSSPFRTLTHVLPVVCRRGGIFGMLHPLLSETRIGQLPMLGRL